ncbi:MAG: hypothetical protein KDA61_14920 [Planctomycetales bacterium]|nr:hypothetical protein [Planctomycetales bacterium]
MNHRHDASPSRIAPLQLKFVHCFAAALLLLTHAGRALAGGCEENLALLVNLNDPSSLAVANEYAALRHIPPSHVFYVRAPANSRAMKAADFLTNVVQPFARELESRGLADQIRYVAVSAGLPYRIDMQTYFPSTQFPSDSKPFASISGALFFAREIYQRDASVIGRGRNPFFSFVQDGDAASESIEPKAEVAAGDASMFGPGRQRWVAVSLGVTVGRGNTVEEIVSYLRRAEEADGTRPADAAVRFMKNGDVRSRVRDATFPAAVAKLSELGVSAAVQQGVCPRNEPHLMGLTTGSRHVRIESSGTKLQPGALVDNLTSMGAQFYLSPATLKNAKPGVEPQTLLSEYMRQGAAGASGTVVEPLAIPGKFPSAFLHVHYARGLCLAEAFYRSVALPCHLLVVGDPLCRPWATEAKVSVVDELARSELSGTSRLKPTAKFAPARKLELQSITADAPSPRPTPTPSPRSVDRFELFVDGLLLQTCKEGESFELDTTQLEDGPHRFTVVAVDAGPIATRSAWRANVNVANTPHALSLVAVDPQNANSETKLTVVATSSQSGPIEIWHNHRIVGRSPKSGRIAIDGAKLGAGPVELVAKQSRGVKLISRPLSLVLK